MRKLINEAYERTRALIIEHSEGLDRLAQALLAKEILFQHDLEVLIGKRPFDTKTTYQEYMDTPETVIKEEEETKSSSEEENFEETKPI